MREIERRANSTEPPDALAHIPTLFHNPSSRRKPGGGFTFEVQQLADEDLSRGLEVKALSGCVVVGPDELIEARGGDVCEIGLARQGAAHSANGVFDAALL